MQGIPTVLVYWCVSNIKMINRSIARWTRNHGTSNDPYSVFSFVFCLALHWREMVAVINIKLERAAAATGCTCVHS